jgi:hypothetical protein
VEPEVLLLCFIPALSLAQARFQWEPEIFLGTKRPGREDDHSPSSAAVEHEWRHASRTPLYAVMSYLETLLLMARILNQRNWSHALTFQHQASVSAVWWKHLLRTWIRPTKKFGVVVSWSNREVEWIVPLCSSLCTISSLSSCFLYRTLYHFLCYNSPILVVYNGRVSMWIRVCVVFYPSAHS